MLNEVWYIAFNLLLTLKVDVCFDKRLLSECQGLEKIVDGRLISKNKHSDIVVDSTSISKSHCLKIAVNGSLISESQRLEIAVNRRLISESQCSEIVVCGEITCFFESYSFPTAIRLAWPGEQPLAWWSAFEGNTTFIFTLIKWSTKLTPFQEATPFKGKWCRKISGSLWSRVESANNINGFARVSAPVSSRPRVLMSPSESALWHQVCQRCWQVRRSLCSGIKSAKDEVLCTQVIFK